MQFAMRWVVTGFLCLALLTVAGCSHHVVDVTVFSTKNVDMSYPHKRLERTAKEDGRIWLLFIPLGGTPNGIEAANEILDDQNADYLTNVEVTEGGWSLLAISRGWVKVEADPWRKE